jgi:uncharacterized protein DUF1217
MSFQPVTPLGGVAGWAFLNRTLERQSESFANSPEIKRETAYFRDNISTVSSAKELVADRQLLKVALGSVGLQDDLDKRFFIRKVLEEGTDDPGAMANRLVDKRYAALADAFGFGSKDGYRTKLTGFGGEITAAYETRQFEVAVGDNDQSLRLALNFKREITDIAAGSATGDTGWYKILGTASLREVVEKSFNLPREFATLDLDRQVLTLKEKARVAFGSDEISLFQDPEKVENLVTKYLVRSEILGQSSATRGTSAALTILQQGAQQNVGSNTIEALFAALY